jgi:hypothetical protein
MQISKFSIHADQVAGCLDTPHFVLGPLPNLAFLASGALLSSPFKFFESIGAHAGTLIRPFLALFTCPLVAGGCVQAK